jgi:hypothetical protein
LSTFPSFRAERVFNSPLPSTASIPRRCLRAIYFAVATTDSTSPISSPHDTSKKKKNLHRIADQRVHITRLIAVYGPTRRASVTSARCPDSVFVATLVECLRIGEVLSIENLIILDDISS